MYYNKLTLTILSRGAVEMRKSMTIVICVFFYVVGLTGCATVGGLGEDLAKLGTKITHIAGKEYVVKKEDTLGSIALSQCGSSEKWTKIKEVNNITDSKKITVGQKIKISC